MIRNAVQPRMVDDIVWSAWKHAVGYNPRMKLTHSSEHKRSKQNSILWNTGLDSDKDTARKRKRRMKYVSNIYVISDKSNPKNEGKVFLYEYGKSIFDKIMAAMNPEFDDEKPINPFDLWEGANFKIKIRNKDGWINYDASAFDSSSEFLDGDEEKLEKVIEQLYDINEFVDPETFKSYSDLDKKLQIVLGPDYVETESADHAPKEEKKESQSKSKKSAIDDDAPFDSEDDSDDDISKFFEGLANED